VRRRHSTQSTRSQIFSANSAVSALIFVSLFFTACGKKGPPLPPLVKVPVAPSDVTAVRRANAVDLQLTVPSANTDSSRPANVARVEVYAFTGPAAVSDADLLKQGTKVASIAVKAPRDPNDTFDPGDPEQSEADIEPPGGAGLDQGTVAHVQEALPPPAVTGAAPATPSVRTYVGVGITTKGRRGPLSRRAAVSLVSSPPSPSKPDVTYTETAITVKWPALPTPPDAAASTKVAYNVYEVADSSQTPLTKAPIADTQYADARLTWGATRCYAVRSVETIGALAVESEATPTACVTLADTFPPAPPKGLQAVATEGVINLIWDANTEPDLDGYILLRAIAPGDELAPVTPLLIRETAFQDPVPAGVRYVYALKAVDRTGNVSPPSERIEETAR